MARKIDEAQRLEALTRYERELWERGIVVGGVDEVGRGPLAGPVVAACVVLPPSPLIEGINDSKKLSAAKREHLDQQIRQQALFVGIGICSQDTIDTINIRQAARQAMAQAVKQTTCGHILVDAESVPLDIEQTKIVHGDALSYLIGAASIVAKVYRDALMDELDKLYPQYGFAKNKGYGTKAHMKAIEEFGLCPCHRLSFTKRFQT